MPGKASTEVTERADIGIKVTQHEVRLGASINHDAIAPKYAWNSEGSDLVHEFTMHLTIRGIATFPPEHAADTYEISLYAGGASTVRNLATTLKDIQALDERDHPVYKKYRGRHVPVYAPPLGLALLNRNNGERCWRGWLQVTDRFASDAQTLLSQARPVYLSIGELRVGRTRWLASLNLQTTDPADE